MKRIFILIACVAMFTACGGNKKEVKQQDSENPKSEELVAGSIILNSADFTQKVADLSKEWKYLGDKPAVIDFYADWCGPCKMVSPVVDQIAKEHPEYKIVKVNVDEQPELASKFNIMSIPALFVVKNGEIVNKSVGAKPKSKILEMLKVV